MSSNFAKIGPQMAEISALFEARRGDSVSMMFMITPKQPFKFMNFL